MPKRSLHALLLLAFALLASLVPASAKFDPAAKLAPREFWPASGVHVRKFGPQVLDPTQGNWLLHYDPASGRSLWSSFDPLGLETVSQLRGKVKYWHEWGRNQRAELYDKYKALGKPWSQEHQNEMAAVWKKQRDWQKNFEARIERIEATARWVNKQMGFEVYDESNIDELDDGDGSGTSGSSLFSEDALLGNQVDPNQAVYRDYRAAMAAKMALREAVVNAAGGAVGKLGVAGSGKLYGALAARLAKTTAGAADDIYVIGRQVDIAVAKDWAGHKILDIPNWTLKKNDAWVQGIIDSRAKVYIGTPQTPKTLWDAANNRPTVFARELEQLRAAGYKQVGDYMHPPGL